MALRLMRVSAPVLCALLWWGCTTVHVSTQPPDATIVANGEDISETGEFKERPGLRAHAVEVSAKGYLPASVEVPRTTMVPWLKWVSLLGSATCATGCASTGCCCGGMLCNRNLLPSILGGGLGVVGGLAGPLDAMIAVGLVNSAAPDAWTLPGMALGTALGSLPLLGLMIPLLYLHAADEVTVKLEKQPAPAE